MIEKKFGAKRTVKAKHYVIQKALALKKIRLEGKDCNLEASNTPFMDFAIMNGMVFENLCWLGKVWQGEIFTAEDSSDEDVAT